jgi:CrcB protein
MPSTERRDGWTADQAVDPDVDLHVREQRAEWRTRRWALPAASAGGMLGAVSRYALEQALPPSAGGWPSATFAANVSGCFLLALVMAVLVGTGRHGSLWRVFLGVGVLGGYTTFSTYAVQAATLLRGRHEWLAVTYLFGTVIAAAAAVLLGLLLGRMAVRARSEAAR